MPDNLSITGRCRAHKWDKEDDGYKQCTACGKKRGVKY